MENFLIILPWVLALVTSLAMYIRESELKDLKQETKNIRDHLAVMEDAKNHLDDLFKKQEDNYNSINQAKEKLISELQHKLRGMIAPDPNYREPIIIMEGKLQRLSSKLNIPAIGGDVSKFWMEVERWKQKFLEEITPFILFESHSLKETLIYSQEIYVAKPERLQT